MLGVMSIVIGLLIVPFCIQAENSDSKLKKEKEEISKNYEVDVEDRSCQVH